jgi:hypothetical protein
MVLLVMVVSIRQTLLLVLVLVLSLVGGGCMEQTTQQPPTKGATEAGTQGNGQATSQPLGPGVDAAAVSARLHAIAAAGKLATCAGQIFRITGCIFSISTIRRISLRCGCAAVSHRHRHWS